jgi:hypothetical protein
MPLAFTAGGEANVKKHPIGSIGDRILVAVISYPIVMFAGMIVVHIHLGTLDAETVSERLVKYVFSTVASAFLAVSAVAFLSAVLPAKLSNVLTGALASTARRAWFISVAIVAITACAALWATLRSGP